MITMLWRQDNMVFMTVYYTPNLDILSEWSITGLESQNTIACFITIV